jgi:hypothetical protein
MVLIPSEYIQIIASSIYAIALFYTIVTFRRSKRIDQVTLSNSIFSELRGVVLHSSVTIAVVVVPMFWLMVLSSSSLS